jgi:hypothetical protein
MNASEIAAQLGEVTNAGRGWWHCRCPMCSKPNLGLKDGKKWLQIKCLHGCSSKKIRTELKSRKLLNGKGGNGELHEPETEEQLRAAAAEAAECQRQIDQARDIWQQTLSAIDSMAATYLAARGLDYHSISPALRFSPAVFHPTEKRDYPALVGRVKYKTGEDVAVHCICLNPLDPGSKLSIKTRKISYGPTKGGAVCLSPYSTDLASARGSKTRSRSNGRPESGVGAHGGRRVRELRATAAVGTRPNPDPDRRPG